MFNIDLNSANPVYQEIANTIIKLIINGTYKKNDKLPSIRMLSHSLSINHNTVQRAYLELEHRGYIYSVTGKGMFVCENIEHLNILEKEKIENEYQSKINELIKLGMSKEEIITLTKKALAKL